MHKVERFFYFFFYPLSPYVIENVSEYVAMPGDTTVITSHIKMCEVASTLNLGTDKVYLLQQKYPNGHNPVPDPMDSLAEASVARGTVLEKSWPCLSSGALAETVASPLGCGDGVTALVRRLRTAGCLNPFGVSSRQTCPNSVRNEAHLI